MKISLLAPPRLDIEGFVNELSIKYKLPIAEDPLRATCIKYGFQTAYDMPVELQLKIRESVLRDHLIALEHGQNAIFPFCPCMWLADWMRWTWSSVPAEKWEEITAIAKLCMEQYDKVILLSGSKVAAYDGYTWLDQDNSRQLASLGTYLLSSLTQATRIETVCLD